MPVSAGTVQFSYTGNGTTTVFAFPSRFLSNSDIIVGVNGALVSSGFVTIGQGEETGGTVTFDVAPPNGQTVTLIRAPAISQLLDFVNNQTVLAENIDNGLDKLTIIAQYLNYLIERTIRLSQFDTGLTGNYDAQGKRIGNVAAPVASADVVRLIDIQGIVAAAGSVPLPTGGQIGYVLQAISAGVFGWTAQGSVQPLNANLTSLAALVFAANKGVYATGPGALALYDLTALGRAVAAATASTALAAGTDAQGSGALAQANDFAFVTNAPNPVSGVTMPQVTAGQQGRQVTVFFSPAASNLINIYPTTGQGFEGLALNAPISLRPGELLLCTQLGTTWAYQVTSQFMRRRPLAGGFTLSDLDVPSVSWVDAFVDLRSLGRGQTWQNMTGSRVAGTSYQNLTGRPVMLAITVSLVGIGGGGALGRGVEVSTDNLSWVVVSKSGADGTPTQSVIVPPNHYYRHVGAFDRWAELR